MPAATKDQINNYFYYSLVAKGVDPQSAARMATIMADSTETDGMAADDQGRVAPAAVPAGGCSVPGLFPS